MANTAEELRAAAFRSKIVAQAVWRRAQNLALRGDKTARKELEAKWAPLRRQGNE